MSFNTLPFKEPTIRGFLDYSFIFGLVGQRAAYDKFLYSFYGSMCIVHTFYCDVYDPLDLFPGPKLRQLIRSGALEADGVDLWSETASNSFSIVEIIAKRLKSGYYCLATLDEYFLEGKAAFKRVHSIHHNLVIGYNSERQELALAGYFRVKDSDYGIKWVSVKHFIMAYAFKGHLLRKNDDQEIFAFTSYKYLLCIRVNTSFQYEFNAYTFAGMLREYLNASATTEQLGLHNKDISLLKVSVGIAIYERLGEHIGMMLSGLGTINLHELRLFSEHKHFMLERARYAATCGMAISAGVIGELEDIYLLAKKLRMGLHAEKLSPMNRGETAKWISDGLSRCRDKEKTCYERLLKGLLGLQKM